MADGQCQPDPQTLQGYLSVFGLTSPLVGFGRDTTWPMGDHDRRFDFVAMLASRSAAASADHIAIGQQFFLG